MFWAAVGLSIAGFLAFVAYSAIIVGARAEDAARGHTLDCTPWNCDISSEEYLAMRRQAARNEERRP